MMVWDTAGQERFQTITRTFYKGSTGIILTYAVDDRESFNNVRKWMKQIIQNAPKNVCKILIGNKSDMPGRQVEEREGLELANSLGIPFFETSAKDNINIEECFGSIAKEIKDKLIGLDSGIIIKGDHKVELKTIIYLEDDKSGCC